MEIDKCGKLNPNGVERFLLRYYFKNANYGRAEYINFRSPGMEKWLDTKICLQETPSPSGRGLG